MGRSSPPELTYPVETVRERLAQLVEEGTALDKKKPFPYAFFLAGSVDVAQWMEKYRTWRHQVLNLLERWFSTNRIANQFISLAPARLKSTYRAYVLEVADATSACHKECGYLQSLLRTLDDYLPSGDRTKEANAVPKEGSQDADDPRPTVNMQPNSFIGILNVGKDVSIENNRIVIGQQAGPDPALVGLMQRFDEWLRDDLERGACAKEQLEDWEIVKEEFKKAPEKRGLRSLETALDRLLTVFRLGTRLGALLRDIEPMLRDHVFPKLPG